jgi:hypothetical protein
MPPNHALEPTAYSVRSFLAPASGGGSLLAFGSRRKEGTAVASLREARQTIGVVRKC